METITRSPLKRGDLVVFKDNSRILLGIAQKLGGSTRFHEFVRSRVISHLEKRIAEADLLLRVGFVGAYLDGEAEELVGTEYFGDPKQEDDKFWKDLGV